MSIYNYIFIWVLSFPIYLSQIVFAGWVDDQIRMTESAYLAEADPIAKKTYAYKIIDIIHNRNGYIENIYIKVIDMRGIKYGYYYAYDITNKTKSEDASDFLSKLFTAYSNEKEVYFYTSTKNTDLLRILYLDFN